MSVAHNIYIHVPFCISKCNYCAFFSRACANPDWDAYATGIIAEIDYWAEKLGKITVSTVFFGGGTPSLMPSTHFTQIMKHLDTKFNVLPNAEITLESNPGTLNTTHLDEFIAGGVNRLSIGVQSLDDNELVFLGRRHNVHDAMQLITTAMSRNIRVSADFIYGLPGHTAQTVEKLCKNVNKVGLTHCSMYELTIEPSTPFGKMKLQMPTNSEMADMYKAIANTLTLPRYEVSNYAALGHECRHNQNVWDGDAYIGLGVGAAGRVFMNNSWYEQLGGGARFEKMSIDARATEKVITGMRTTRGVLLANDVKNVLDMEYINNNPKLITIVGDRMHATERGLMILDDLLVNVIK